MLVCVDNNDRHPDHGNSNSVVNVQTGSRKLLLNIVFLQI